MKKIKIMFMVMLVYFLTGCGFNTSTLENAEIYTTVYPLEYIVNSLYGDNSTVESIYPSDANIFEYDLTNKQIEKYAQGDLFVYIGLGKEKEFAKNFLNENEDLLIIDASYGLSYNEDIEEMWLAPNNFLMLAKNVKNSLNEYLDNAFKTEKVNENYDKLYESVSWVDAELRNVAKEAVDYNTIIIADNVLKFLENYGFNVISLEDIEKSGSSLQKDDIKSKFKNSTYTKILTLKGMQNSELVNTLVNKNKAKLVELNNIVSNKDTSSDYVSIQYENIALIRDYVSK